MRLSPFSPFAALALLACLAASGPVAPLAADDAVLSVKVGEVDVQVFVPAGAKVVRGAVVHAAHYQLKTDDRWSELLGSTACTSLPSPLQRAA